MLLERERLEEYLAAFEASANIWEREAAITLRNYLDGKIDDAALYTLFAMIYALSQS